MKSAAIGLVIFALLSSAEVAQGAGFHLRGFSSTRVSVSHLGGSFRIGKSRGFRIGKSKGLRIGKSWKFRIGKSKGFRIAQPYRAWGWK